MGAEFRSFFIWNYILTLNIRYIFLLFFLAVLSKYIYTYIGILGGTYYGNKENDALC
jgi:hypothetical protein